jgi:DNA polymerase (family X)
MKKPLLNKQEIAITLEEIADLLDLTGENPFKVRAYRNAARALLNLEEDLKTVLAEHRLQEIEGIGASLAEKIATLAHTGRLPLHQKLKRTIPSGMVELLQIQGLGPKKIQVLYKKLKIKSAAALKRAAQQGKIAKLRGFGAKTEQNILQALEHRETYQLRHLWWDAWEMASSILQQLRKVKGVKEAEIAGSVRRKIETIGDLDFVVGSSAPQSVMNWFTSQPFIERVFSKGPTKASVLLKGNFRSDIRIVSEREYPFALLYFTGSKEHNIELRSRAIRLGWSLSEYDLTMNKKGIPAPFPKNRPPRSEEEIYALFDLPYIPCELRENRGEFEAAERRQLPHLIEECDVRGTFHVHTTASDGRTPLKEMVAMAETLGWEYIGISDHSRSAFQANGLSEEQLEAQIEEIHKLNASKNFHIHVFAGTECDILTDGSLDYSDLLLQKLDFVIASVHSSLQQDEKVMTRRMIRAIEHPYTTMIGHLTGRLLLRREASSVNVMKVIDACIANKKIIELNANPMRLDMDWRYWRTAAERGLLCSINPDAHAADQLLFIRAGINSARKGWLEKQQVINTYSLRKVQTFLRR